MSLNPKNDIYKISKKVTQMLWWSPVDSMNVISHRYTSVDAHPLSPERRTLFQEGTVMHKLLSVILKFFQHFENRAESLGPNRSIEG